MQSREITLKNPSGLHARPATVFVRAAGGLRSSVRVRNLDRPGPDVDGKSILEVLTLGVSKGDRISLMLQGEDEDTGLRELSSLIESGLGDAPS